MWHILFMILKIAGITLGILLLLLLLVIFFVLFVPVRYKVFAEGKLGEKESLYAKIKIHWLFHIVNASFLYPERPVFRVRFLFFTIFRPDKKQKRKSKKSRKKQNEQDDQEDQDGAAQSDAKLNAIGENSLESDEDLQETDASESIADPKITIQEEIERELAQDNDPAQEAESTKEEKPKEKPGIFQRIFDKICQILSKIQYTIKRICDTIKNVIKNIQYYLDLLENDKFKDAYKTIVERLCFLCRKLKPKKCIIHLTAGTGDPAGTGQILAIYGMLYPFIGKNVAIQADFDHLILEGDIYVKGKIQIAVLLYVAWRLYKDKNIRYVLKHIQKEEI